MPHQIYTITDFEIVAPYTLHLTFDDGVVKTIDLSPILRGELYSPLRDLEFFNQVKLDRDAGTIVWPNEADFDPATLHDWDEVGAEMIEMASKWEIKAPTVESMTFEQVLQFARDLEPSAKIKLIRILAQDLETFADKLAPLEPFTTYQIYTPFVPPGTATALKEALDKYEAEEKQDQDKE